MTNLIISGLSEMELRRVERSIIDICSLVDQYVNGMTHLNKEAEQLEVELRTLVNCLDKASEIVLENRRPSLISEDQLTLW